MEIASKHSPEAAETPEAPLFDDASPRAKPPRSFGLRAFDAFLYPGVTNVGVFATSVFFTYLTNRGSHFGKTGSNARKFGELMQQRGEWLKGHIMSAGLSEGAANNAKMVFWSFADGTLLAPVIKGFEDNRENIARTIDRWAGTEPDDPSVYDAEPKQSWGSVLGARALTAGIVAPTAGILEKTNFGGKNLNQIMFYEPGLKLGSNVRKNYPRFSARFSEGTFREISKVTYFEAFYTSICTAGQYFISRALARVGDHRFDAPPPSPQPSGSADQPRLSSLMQPPQSTLAEGEPRHSEPLQSASASLSAS